jgi:hypothetical protein
MTPRVSEARMFMPLPEVVLVNLHFPFPWKFPKYKIPECKTYYQLFYLRALIARCWRLTPIILSIQEAEIRRITVKSQPGQNPSQKGAGGMAQGVGPEFKPQYCKKKKLRLPYIHINVYSSLEWKTKNNVVMLGGRGWGHGGCCMFSSDSLHPVHGLGERFKQERLTASWDKWPL